MTNTDTAGPMTMRVGEVARLLGIGRSSAYEAARNGQIPTIRVGRRLLVPRPALDRMLGCQDEEGHRAGNAMASDMSAVESPRNVTAEG